MEMRTIETVMPVDVMRKALRRPSPSRRKTERMEQIAYSIPPHAAIKCDMPGGRLNDDPRI